MTTEHIRDFMDALFRGGISYTTLDAIHDIAKKNKVSPECWEFEEWYKENVGEDEE